MPSRNAQTVWIQQFKGQWDMLTPGAPPEAFPETQNVKIQFGGHVMPRGGMNRDFDFGIPPASTEVPIIGLFTYPNTTGETQLVRMLPTHVQSFSTSSGTWGDITGATPLTGNAQTVPQYTIIDDILVFINEGADLPRKWDVVVGGVSETIGSGSTPPFAKAIESYLGFLFLGNVSDDGSFSDVVDGHRMIVYSDDWDNDWEGCAGNHIILDETPGALLRMVTLGKDVICFKDDGIVKVKWVGGTVRFQQEKFKFDLGISGPLSAVKVSDDMIFFLATDGVIYKVTASAVEAISEDALAQTIPITVPLNRLHWAMATVHNEDSYYYLFFDKLETEEGFTNWYVGYQYRERTFVQGELGEEVRAVVTHKWAPNKREKVLVAAISAAAFVVRWDDLRIMKDDTKRIDKHIITNWVGLQEEGWCHGARLIFWKEPAVDTEITHPEAGGGGGGEI